MARSASFKLDISAFVEKAADRADLITRKLSLEMLERIVDRSPVDTGRFRGHWMVGIGQVPTGLTGILDKSGDIAKARAETALTRARAGHVIYLANNLPYAVRLEYGHSKKQAPNGMVRRTIAEFQAAAQAAAAAAKRERP